MSIGARARCRLPPSPTLLKRDCSYGGCSRRAAIVPDIGRTWWCCVREARRMSSTDTVRRIEDLPCWRCTDPRGEDLRHALAQTGGVVNEAQCSPTTGLPIGLLPESIDADHVGFSCRPLRSARASRSGAPTAGHPGEEAQAAHGGRLGHRSASAVPGPQPSSYRPGSMNWNRNWRRPGSGYRSWRRHWRPPAPSRGARARSGEARTGKSQARIPLGRR